MTEPKVGEVYHDDVFDCEVKILDLADDMMLIEDYVSDESGRDYRRWQWDHNVSVGRFSKLRDESVNQDKETSENGTEQGILDF